MVTKVSKDNLPQLQQWLQNLFPNSFMLHGVLKNHLRGKFPDVDFYVDSWPDLQVAVAVPDPAGEKLKCKEFFQNMVLGLAGVDDEALAVILRDKRVVDWSRPTYILAVADKHCGVVKTLAEEMKGTLHVVQQHLMRATKHDSEPESVPKGIAALPISEDDIATIEQTWDTFDSEFRGDYIREQIQHFPSVVLKSESGQHVGHGLARSGGMMGMLYVLPSFRRKGYAKVIISQLAQTYFECGEDAYAIVRTDNYISQKVHASVGFKILPEVTLCLLRYLPKEC